GQRHHRGPIGDVARDGQGADSHRFDLGGDRSETLGARRDEHQVHAVLRQQPRELAPDALARSGDDRSPPRELFHALYLRVRMPFTSVRMPCTSKRAVGATVALGYARDVGATWTPTSRSRGNGTYL